MATPRFLVVLLLLGAVAILVVQNTSPALPLVFLGIRTPALPLALWLVGAIALGTVTSLAMASLVSAGTSGAGRGRQTPNRSGRRIDDPNFPPNTAASTDFNAKGGAKSRAGGTGRQGNPAEGEWGEWTNLRSPGQWEDWSQAEQASGPAGPEDKTPFWGRKRAVEQARKVDESWQELSDGWNDLENVRYRPQGVSPVADALDELDEGWDDYPDAPAGNRPSASRQDFEAEQSPKRVYRDGSIYSYSYREGDSDQGRTDSIYGPEDNDQDYEDDYEDDEFENEDSADDESRDPRLGRVVDADYRVIIPPHRPLEKSDSDDDDEDWIDGVPNR